MDIIGLGDFLGSKECCSQHKYFTPIVRLLHSLTCLISVLRIHFEWHKHNKGYSGKIKAIWELFSDNMECTAHSTYWISLAFIKSDTIWLEPFQQTMSKPAQGRFME